MTTDSATPPGDLSRIEALFKKRGAELRCPVCGQEAMTVFDELEADGLSLKMRFKNVVGGVWQSVPMKMPIITVACNNCGLVRQFAKPFLASAQDGADG
jgi:transcription elongation factor Elf1